MSFAVAITSVDKETWLVFVLGHRNYIFSWLIFASSIPLLDNHLLKKSLIKFFEKIFRPKPKTTYIAPPKIIEVSKLKSPKYSITNITRAAKNDLKK